MLWLFALLLLVALALNAFTWLRRRARTPAPGNFTDAAGARLHYVSRGSGPAVVFLHGNDATHLDFTLSLLDYAAAAGYRAIAFDRPGHGYSTAARGAASVLAQMESIRAALAALGITRPIIVGHSWSGAVALAYAVAHPDELGGIVLLGGAAYASGSGLFPDPRFITLVPGLGRLAWSTGALFARPFVLRSFRQAFSPAPVPPEWLNAVAPFEIWDAAHVQAAARDFLAPARELPALSARYPEIRVPTVIVTGDRDASVPPVGQGYRLARDIPHATVITVPGAGHMLPFTHPEAVLDAIRRVTGR
jgi:pimeloyl-ACP methyl ester carboxylesterase